jgi:hypothetical protein
MARLRRAAVAQRVRKRVLPRRHDPEPKCLSHSCRRLAKRIDEVEAALHVAVGSLGNGNVEEENGARTAAWYVRGQIYHARRLYQHYLELADEASRRVSALLPDNPPDVLVFASPALQELLYEFYAFLGLARISLDELRHLLRPVLVPTQGGSLPKSIKALVRGVTNCPLLLALRNEPMLDHVIDIRDCLVHHKTFASSEPLIVVKDGSEVDLEPILQQGWSRPVTLPSYRLIDDNRIVFNVWLADQIYSYPTPDNRGPIVSPFTYEQRTNLVTQILEYLRFGAYQVIQSVSLLREHKGEPYTWAKKADCQPPPRYSSVDPFIAPRVPRP